MYFKIVGYYLFYNILTLMFIKLRAIVFHLHIKVKFHPPPPLNFFGPKVSIFDEWCILNLLLKLYFKYTTVNTIDFQFILFAASIFYFYKSHHTGISLTFKIV